MPKNFIKFINHASVVISNGKKSILTDPWYSGTSFDDGWMLLYENEKSEIINILNQTDYIWISHEHPDHFSIKFLNDYEDILREKKIKFIFQDTKDKRVVSFLKFKKFDFIELEDNQKFDLDEKFFIKVQKYDFYDSALIININGKKIFNLNDCPIKTENQVKEFKKKYGECDFLLTQFSYAAWKGGKENLEWRKSASKEKINTIKNQSNILNSKITIPFASFIKFCDKYNSYLNDSINTPNIVMEKCSEINAKIKFLKPYEVFDLDNPYKETDGIGFWTEIYKNRDNFQIIENKKSYTYEDLNEMFYEFNDRIYKNNSKILIKIISKIKFLNYFQALIIKIKDLDVNIKVDLANNKFEKVNEKPDIEMFSRSLYLIFKQDFGFDTLTVNGCFEERKNNGFLKMSKCFAIGNLNNLGIKLNYKIFLNLNIIFLFLKKIFIIKKKLV